MFIIHRGNFKIKSNLMLTNNCIFDEFDINSETVVQSFYNLIEIFILVKSTDYRRNVYIEEKN